MSMNLLGSHCATCVTLLFLYVLSPHSAFPALFVSLLSLHSSLSLIKKYLLSLIHTLV